MKRKDVVTSLMDLLEEGTTADVDPPVVDAAVAAAHEELRRAAIARSIRVALGIGALFAIALVTFIFWPGHGELGPMEMVFLPIAAIFGALAFTVPALIVIALVQRAKPPLFKRLRRPGRWLSGICLGLSEAWGVHVGLIRLAFVVGLGFDGLGLLVYLVLELAMPVHPDDRQHMLRFKIRRWWAAHRKSSRDPLRMDV